MSKSSSTAARAFATVALICGFLLVIVVIAGSLGGDGGDGSGGGGSTTQTSSKGKGGGSGKQGKARRFYVVQNGDTLTSIARKTGVSVDRIEALNPGVDPQILVSGDKLQLRP